MALVVQGGNGRIAQGYLLELGAEWTEEEERAEPPVTHLSAQLPGAGFCHL